MIDIREIYKKLISIDNPKASDYWDSLNKVMDFVDKVLYKSDDFIYSYQEAKINGYDVNMFYQLPKQDLEIWPDKKVQKYIDIIFDVFSKFFLIKGNIIKQTVFAELKALGIFYTKRILKDSRLNSSDKIAISDESLFYQFEIFEFMYSFFDKLNYIFQHLYEKYIDSNGKLDVKFHIDFVNNVMPFVKDDTSKEDVKSTLYMFTSSSVWHYLRKLRNKIVHDFINPSEKYNLSYDIKLMYINICRIIFMLDAYIIKDKDFIILINQFKKNS